MRQLFPFAHNGLEITPTTDLPIPQSEKGVFTTLKVVNATPLFLEKHLQRLTEHAKRIGISVSLSDVPNHIQEVLAANKTTTAAVRISVLEDTVLIHVTTLPQAGENVSAVTYKTNNTLPTIKQIDRTIYTKAQEYAKLHGAESALFVGDNFFLESSISNIVSIDADGQLITPPLTIQGLKGIMRQVLLAKGVLVEKEIHVTENYPLVLINSLRVQAVTSLNEKELPDPSKLLHKIQQYIAEEEKVYEDSYHR